MSRGVRHRCRSAWLLAFLGAIPTLGGETPVRADSARVEILDFGYAPTELVVPATSRVTWQNRGEVRHTVVVDEVANSGELNPGAVFTHAFDTPGNFSVRCTIHSSMRGVVRVTDAPATPQPQPQPPPQPQPQPPVPAPGPSNPPPPATGLPPRTSSANTTTTVTAMATVPSTTASPSTTTTITAPATSTSTTAPTTPTTVADSTPVALPDPKRARRSSLEAEAEVALPVPEPTSDSLMSATGVWLVTFGLVWSLWRRRPRRA